MLEECTVGRGAPLSNNFPQSMHGYIVHGFYPGKAYGCILAGDLFGAAESLNYSEHHNLASITRWVMYCAPPECWGSADKVLRWSQDRDYVRSDYNVRLSMQIAECEVSGASTDVVHGHLKVLTEQERYSSIYS